MTPVRFRPEAAEEVAEAATFYAARAPGLAEEFLLELQKALDLATTAPDAGARYPMGTRRLLLQRFPYSVVYRPETDFVWIVAVAHQRRRPGYWRRRV